MWWPPDDSLQNSELLQNLDVLLAYLTVEKHTELAELIKSYPSLFGCMPSQTHVIKHWRFYRVSEEKRKLIDDEVSFKLGYSMLVCWKIWQVTTMLHKFSQSKCCNEARFLFLTLTLMPKFQLLRNFLSLTRKNYFFFGLGRLLPLFLLQLLWLAEG